MKTRRGFLAGVLAAGVAPIVVKAGVLMPVRKIIVPPSTDIIIINAPAITRLGTFDTATFDNIGVSQTALERLKFSRYEWLRHQFNDPYFTPPQLQG
jgi:hypothetical protein